MANEGARALTPEEQSKTIVVEFADGPLDGTVLRTDSDDRSEVEQTLLFYTLISGGGERGRQFRASADTGLDNLEEYVEDTPEGPRLKEPTPAPNQVYEVADRQEDEVTIRVHYQYIGQDE